MCLLVAVLAHVDMYQYNAGGSQLFIQVRI